MPWTNFPNGISVTTATGSASGTINATTLIATNGTFGGTVTVGTLATGAQGSAGTGIIGGRAYLNGTFTSAAGTTWVATPMAGNLVDCITTADTTPRTCSGLTIQSGSGGAVAVATVALAFATAIGQQVRPTLTPIAVTTASGIGIIVTTAGSACNFSYTLVIEKTA